MRRMRHATTLCALILLGAAASTARPDGGEGQASTDDLLSTVRPFYGGQASGGKWGKGSKDVPWTDWWYANRRNLVGPTTRTTNPEAAGKRDDPKVRARAHEALRRALRSKDQLVASEAALALGRFGDPADTSALCEIVRDRDISASRRLHIYAAIGLGQLPLGEPAQASEARAALVGALESSVGQGDEFSYFWTNCAYALAMRGDMKAVPDLVMLREQGVSARRTKQAVYIEILGGVCYALGVLGGDVVLPEIADHLSGRKGKDGGSNDTSWSATHALARMTGPDVSGPDVRALLVKAAVDKRVLVRAGAFQALGSVAASDDDETAKLLRKALEDDDELGCRRMAAIALGRQGHPTAAAALLRSLDKGRSEVRTFAALGLGLYARSNPDPKVSKALVRELQDASAEEQRASLALACGLAGLADAAPELVELVERGHSTAGPLAAWALARAGGGGKAGLEALHGAVERSGNVLMRREAALALATLGDPAVTGRLRAIVGSKSADINRASAAAALGRVGTDADLDFLLDVLAAPKTSDGLRPCIVHAIGWIVDRTDYARLSRIAADVKWDKHVRGVSLSWTGEAMWDIQHLVD